ncbi:molybdopterin-guanine dinucleotide biosynthesis protein MobB [Beggiatoa alba B18LD]|uniref:Molybdopterin-guanine dinucleotide biosynthesis protein MobB n=1 Tax=Beggiatoa alba B18LD TaxID=395493 RepID=I3CGP4_9GAMM|nr:molybdopterin-guanine dinucleotide biosynthesis protein B [Beggiatoa alba]EIJ42787.1 molybdopterin-guanine dinucleotide biosynthesis protein MobB [Beggiatoa alba B18LD]
MSLHPLIKVPLVGFAAYSGTGKTTLILKILPLLKAQGLRVGVIKHAHHQFEIDQAGKDSYRIRKEGEVEQLLIASRQRWVLMTETGQTDEPYLHQVLPHLNQETLDLVIVEGFKHEQFPKIELYRPSLNKALIFPNDASIIAIASDAPLPVETTLPRLDLNDATDIVQFIEANIIRCFQASPIDKSL